MQISVAIVLSDGEEFSMTPNEAAEVIIDALDGVTPEDDHCTVMIQTSSQGEYGFVPEPAPPPSLR